MGMFVDNHYLHTMQGFAHKQEAHGGAVDRHGQQKHSFTEQLSCPQRIFVYFMQIATESDIT